MRLSKLMAQKGLCSRREADVLIEKGWVLVDGEVINTLGTKVHPEAKIELKKAAQKVQEKKLTFILYKPVGYVSCQPEKNYPSALELIKPQNYDTNYPKPHPIPRYLPKLAVAGRLDIDSKGLLVITQDGRVAKQLIGPTSEIEKEYLIKTKQEIQKKQIEQLKDGLSLDGKRLKKAKVHAKDPHTLVMVLTEGKKRQIRRMCELVGLEVTSLKRVRIGKIYLGKLKVGHFRLLKENETF